MNDRDDGAIVDTGEAFKFLRLIDASAPVFCFQTFAEKGANSSHISPRVIHSSSLAEVRHEHAKGAGIYTVVNETDGIGRKAENIVRIRAVWQEDDDGFDGAFPLAPSIIIESSPQHRHRYWLIADEWPADEQGRADFAGVMERMVETYGSDKSAKDICRVLRVPGFWHRKADKGPVNPFQVRIVEATGERYTRQQILAAFPAVPREPVNAREWKPCGDGWLRGLVRTVANAAVGQRNSILFWAACRGGEAVRDGKATEAFVVDVLIEAATRAGLPHSEAQRTIQSGMHRA